MGRVITAHQHGANTASMTQSVAQTTASADATTTKKRKKMNDFEALAKELYEALMVMCQRRGIHHDDVDQVLDAREHYEEAVSQRV